MTEPSMRFVSLKTSVLGDELLKVFPDSYIGRARGKMGKISAHQNFLFNDKSISKIHCQLYLDLHHQLWLHKRSKHGLILYHWGNDEFRVVKDQRSVEIGNFDMIGVRIVKSFNKVYLDNKLLQCNGFETHENKARLWLRLVTVGKFLAIKVIHGQELNPYLSQEKIASNVLVASEQEGLVDEDLLCLIDHFLDTNKYCHVTFTAEQNKNRFDTRSVKAVVSYSRMLSSAPQPHLYEKERCSMGGRVNKIESALAERSVRYDDDSRPTYYAEPNEAPPLEVE